MWTTLYFRLSVTLHYNLNSLIMRFTQVTQLGHVKDLATAFVKTLGNKKAHNQIYNLAGMDIKEALSASECELKAGCYHLFPSIICILMN